MSDETKTAGATMAESLCEYSLVVMSGPVEDVATEMNQLAARGYKLRGIVQPSTATAPSTYFKPMAVMERTRRAGNE